MTIGKIVGGAGLLVASLVGANQSGVLPSITSDSFCPDGWKQNSPSNSEHGIVYSCERDGILVILTPTKDFERAMVPGEADWVTDPVQVPGWSD